MTQATLSFGRFTLDLGQRVLSCDGLPVPLGSRALDILAVLAEAKGALVTKDVLIGRVWPGLVVEENNVHVHISALRKALDAEGSGQSCIVTVPGRGYRLVGFAEIAPPHAMPDPQSAITPPKTPSIAVLPFQNMSGDPEQEYFVDGMVEEIITALSRIRWLYVTSRNSSFTYKGQPFDVKQVGRELGVRYVVEGSVRKTGNRVRITAQLIDAISDSHLWAERFDGTLEDVFDLQDRVAISVAGIIEPTLQAVEAARSAHRSTNDLTAYDLFLRGYAIAMSQGARFSEALTLMEQAIRRDPRYAPALAWAALGCSRLLMDGRSDDPHVDTLRGVDYARRALEVAGDDPGVIVNAAAALAYFGEDIDAMMGLVDRALALNPNHARGWHISGMLRLHAGQLDLAIEHIGVSFRLSPRARVGWGQTWIGAAHFFARRFDQAVESLLLAIQDDRSFPVPYRFLAACYAHMGQLGLARSIVERLRDVCPVVIADAGFLRNDKHRAFFLSGLRTADGEDS